MQALKSFVASKKVFEKVTLWQGWDSNSAPLALEVKCTTN